MGTQRIHIHESVFRYHSNQRQCRVWREKNRKYHAKCIQTTVKSPVSVQVWGAFSSRGQSLLRKLIGNMDSAKYQSDIIHDSEMTCDCFVFQQVGYILCMISRHVIIQKYSNIPRMQK